MHGTDADDDNSAAEAWLNDPDRAAAIADTAARMAAVLAETRAEQARREAAGDESGARALDSLVVDLAQVAEQTHDLDVAHAIWTVTQRHGGGPYPAEDLATFTGHDLPSVRRVLDGMLKDGLATGPFG